MVSLGRFELTALPNVVVGVGVHKNTATEGKEL